MVTVTRICRACQNAVSGRPSSLRSFRSNERASECSESSCRRQGVFGVHGPASGYDESRITQCLSRSAISNGLALACCAFPQSPKPKRLRVFGFGLGLLGSEAVSLAFSGHAASFEPGTELRMVRHVGLIVRRASDCCGYPYHTYATVPQRLC